MSLLEIKDVFMNYHSIDGETTVLDNINLDIEEGEFISIIGPSGCGKSTLLNIIAGLIAPSKGEVLLEGANIRSIQGQIGYMFQKDHLFPWLSLWENVILGLKIQGDCSNEKKALIEEMLITYGLSEFKNHYPNELSGGMRQRVALIRTLALSPRILLLDEPFSALDSQTRLMVCDEIYQIIKKAGKTVIMVTHDIAEAVSTSSRIVVLSRRPSTIKDIITLKFESKYSTPILRREAQEFRLYYKKIWKEMDLVEERKNK